MMFRFSIIRHPIFQKMQPMHSVVIADTSCFILLLKINEIELLQKLYSRVYTTPQVAKEFSDNFPKWIAVQAVSNMERLQELGAILDSGEASAISLSYEIPDSILVLDDLQARKVALKLHLEFTGTFGIIAKAKQRAIIPSVKPLIEKIRQTNFRFSEAVFLETLKEAGES